MLVIVLRPYIGILNDSAEVPACPAGGAAIIEGVSLSFAQLPELTWGSTVGNIVPS